jgi:hypothetical protein
MGIKEDIMMKKVEPLVAEEFGKGEFRPEDRDQVISTTKTAINAGRVRRIEDLRNFVHAQFDAIATKSGKKY